MVLYYLTGDESLTPDQIADYSMSNAYYVSGAGTAWALISDVPRLYGLDVEEPEDSEWEMKSALDRGRLIICSVGAGDFTVGGHFLVIYGYDEDGFFVNDPNCVARSRKSWSYERLEKQLKHVWTIGKDGKSGGADFYDPVIYKENDGKTSTIDGYGVESEKAAGAGVYDAEAMGYAE